MTTGPDNSKTDINNTNFNLIKTHPLMHVAVLLVDHFYMNRAKHGVQDVGGGRTGGDGWVVTPAGSSNDVMFVGTSTERLLKAVNALSATSQTPTRPVIIAEIEVYEEGVAGTKRGMGK